MELGKPGSTSTKRKEFKMGKDQELYEVIAEVRILSKKFRLSKSTRGQMLGLEKQNAFRARILLDKEGVFRVLYDQKAMPDQDAPVLVLEQRGLEENPDLPELDLSELIDRS